MKDFKSSLASKDKTLREALKSASSPRAPDDPQADSVANGKADYEQMEPEGLTKEDAMTAAADTAIQRAESVVAEAPPSRMSMGSLVEYLMSGPGRKAAKKLKEAEG